MTDLDQLEKDIEAYHWSDVASEDLLKELVSRLRLSEKDAERYRWLRDKATGADWEHIGYQDNEQKDAYVDDYSKYQDRANSRESDTPNDLPLPRRITRPRQWSGVFISEVSNGRAK